LDADTCIVDDEYCFARGGLKIPVHGETEQRSGMPVDRVAEIYVCHGQGRA
jgi:hypothetical protein